MKMLSRILERVPRHHTSIPLIRCSSLLAKYLGNDNRPTSSMERFAAHPVMGCVILLQKRTPYTPPKKRVDRERGIERSQKLATSLLDERNLPVGRFLHYHFKEAKDVIDLYRQRKAVDEKSVNDTWKVFERTCIEYDMAAEKFGRQIHWLGKPKLLNPLILNWKQAYENDAKVSTPLEMMRLLVSCSKRFKVSLVYDINTVRTILEASMSKVDPSKAPYCGEEILEVLQEHEEARKTVTLDLELYNKMLKTWAKSGSPEATEKIDKLIHRMNRSNVSRDDDTFQVILDFAAESGDGDRIEAVLETMSRNYFKVGMQHLALAHKAFIKSGRLDKAEETLEKVLQKEIFARDLPHVRSCLLDTFLEYKNIIQHDIKLKHKDKHEALQAAENIFFRLADRGFFSKTDANNDLVGLMMELYAHADELDRVDRVMETVNLDNTQICFLIKAFGKADKASRATKVFMGLVENKNSTPDMNTLNALLFAWSESSQEDAADQAFTIWKQVEDNKDAEIRANTETFIALMQCLVKSRATHAGERAEILLDEIKARVNASEDVRLSKQIGELAIKCCLSCEDFTRTEMLIERFVQAGSPPSLRTFNEVLESFAADASLSGAKRAENIFTTLIKLSMKYVDLAPTLRSYLIVIQAWIKSTYSKAPQRIWKIYQYMVKNQSVEPDRCIYDTLVRFFVQSEKRSVVEKADFLLQYMASKKELRASLDDVELLRLVSEGWLALDDVESAERIVLWWLKSIAPQAKNVDYLKEAAKMLEQLQEKKDDNSNQKIYEELLWAWKRSNFPERKEQIALLEEKIAGATP